MYKDLDEASEKKKLSFLLLNVGSYAVTIFESLQDIKKIYDDGNIPTLKKALEQLDKRFLSAESEWMSFHKLLTTKKETGEPLKDYLTHLRSLVTGCGVPTNFEDRLIAQLFIVNIEDESIQSELLTMQHKSLAEIETKAVILEKAKNEMTQIQHQTHDVKKLNQESNPANAATHRRRFRSPSRNRNSSGIQSYRSPSRSRHFKCKKCGTQHAPRQCPAFGKTCLKCNKPNHFAKCCFANTSQTFSNPNHSVSHLNYLNKSSDENYYINVSIEQNNVKLQVDTGSDITLLCKNDSLKVMRENVKILPFYGTVQAYDGKPVNIFGKIHATVKIEQKICHDFPVYLTENKGPSLCGKDMIKLLGIKLVSDYSCLKIENEASEREETSSSIASSCTSNFEAEKKTVLQIKNRKSYPELKPGEWVKVKCPPGCRRKFGRPIQIKEKIGRYTYELTDGRKRNQRCLCKVYGMSDNRNSETEVTAKEHNRKFFRYEEDEEEDEEKTNTNKRRITFQDDKKNEEIRTEEQTQDLILENIPTTSTITSSAGETIREKRQRKETKDTFYKDFYM